MNKRLNHVVSRVVENSVEVEEIKKLVGSSKSNLKKVMEAARWINYSRFGRRLKCYYPGKRFPAISITGGDCALSCKHCNRRYIENMIDAATPRKLYNLCKRLDSNGAVGCLISGGFDESGKLPLEPFLNVLLRVKQETRLILNIHSGLVDEELALDLSKVGVDIISLDLVASEEVIRGIYGLNRTPNDYLRTLRCLSRSGIRSLVPHICVGLDGENIFPEMEALCMISGLPISGIVILGFIPTRGTPLESATSPSPEEIARVICAARLMFQDKPLSLGCMRPVARTREKTDKLAILSGINRIEMPTQAALQLASRLGLRVERYQACCAMPQEFESRASF